jgi:hypothetical protein
MRRFQFALLSAVVFLTASIFALPKSKTAQRSTKEILAATPQSKLPINQVVLFNSGVGYFQREGEVNGNAELELAFPAGDINDLLKSLVLQDTGGGKVGSVVYDNQDPIERTLQSFTLDLTYNPTFGQLLSQARGEKAEVTLQSVSGGPSGALTGVIVGLEDEPPPVSAGPQPANDRLNLLCSDGMRSIPLKRIERVKFINPAFQNDFDRALEVLASSHDTQKKQVRLQFTGDGKRKVRLGYVAENPIWKTSYRLALDATLPSKGEKGKGEADNVPRKAFLQGWAMVENVSDDDWKGVRVVLVSGRPISYQMDLYPPLYVPRPIVEPELFASLRPPNYTGPLVHESPPRMGMPGMQGGNLGLGGVGIGLGLAGLGGGGLGALGGGNLGNQGGFAGFGGQLGGGFAGNKYQQFVQKLSGKPGAPNEDEDQQPGRLTFQELQQRRQQKGEAQKVGSAIAALDLKEGIESVASAEEIGNHFQYVVDNKITLPRRKSAMLPIVNKEVQASRVSIFNRSVHSNYPLLGLRFKNTTDLHLMQGPVTVYEGGSYAGDSRFADLQPKEERLLAYAVDLGTEVKVEEKAEPARLVAVKIVKGVFELTSKNRETKTYLIRNRSSHDRVLLIEQPVRNGWKLLVKPAETSRDVYRFEIKVPANQFQKHVVTEERDSLQTTGLLNKDVQEFKLLLEDWPVSPAMKDALNKASGMYSRLMAASSEISRVQSELKTIVQDQERLRQDLKIMPAESAIHKRYLEKFDKQETQIEKLQDEIKKQLELQSKQRKEYEDFLAGLNVE